jgi:hypothetical protein
LLARHVLDRAMLWIVHESFHLHRSDDLLPIFVIGPDPPRFLAQRASEVMHRRVMSAPFVRVDHVQLAIPSDREADARAFYCGLLGMREILKPQPLAARGGLWLQSGGVVIHLGVEADFRAARKAHPSTTRTFDRAGELER